MDVGNDGLGVVDTLADVGNNYICVYCEFGLEADS